MRISTRMFTESALRSVRTNQEIVVRTQEQVTTGNRINTLSDDPIDATRIMRMQSKLRDLNQYIRNGTSTTTRMSTEDVTLTTARDLVQQARELALSVANLDRFSPERQAAINSIEQMRLQVVALANTQLGDEYIFGGAQTTNPPFLRDGTYVGDSTIRQVEIDKGVFIDVNHPGDQVFSATLDGLAELERSLSSGTSLQLDAAIASLRDAQDGMTLMQAETGARLQQIQTTSTTLASRMAGLFDERDAVRQAEPAAAAIKLTAAQSALERAYAAISKVLTINIMDYLR